MSYNDYVERLANKFDAEMLNIEAINNFEYGDEFESTLVKVLRIVTPSMYGVCRGHIVAFNNVTAGDDIVIYDNTVFPTLRSLDPSNAPAVSLEQIPIEGVYCYIEAKHNVHMDKDESEGGSLKKALTQSMNAKKLISTRRERPLDTPIDNVSFGRLGNVIRKPGLPRIYNQAFSMVWARYVSIENRKVADPYTTMSYLFDNLEEFYLRDRFSPDILILGRNCVIVPTYKTSQDSIQMFNGFWMADECSGRVCNASEGHAFGIGFVAMMAALRDVKLAPFNWGHALIEDREWNNLISPI